MTTLELMYDGTDWVIIGNPVVEDYYSETQSYVVYANGLIEQWGKTGTPSVGENTITFFLTFIQNPIVTAIPNSPSGGYVNWYSLVYEIDKTYFKFYGSGQNWQTWYAIGY